MSTKNNNSKVNSTVLHTPKADKNVDNLEFSKFKN